ncbi:hypothetical protein HF521_009975 [Silurus meridionalis]|uniref:MAGUK p55 subfamily member 7 n=1 Tax=Silurus meridionalis TaxID=175797 RepID=A0A8T0AIC1_SILME|nr:hypothetical protein HF521_009975 [Silurus meridionalis]
MLMVNSLHVLIKLHERLQRFGAQKPAPVEDHAEQLAQEIMKELHTLEARPDVKELIHLLSKPHVQELLSVHDIVAQKEYEPKIPALAAEDDEDEEDSVRIICLMKSKEPLGATIKREKSTGAIVVARIMRGGAADRSGLICEGDELREVNGVPLKDKNPEEILPLLAQSGGTVTFKVIPGKKVDLDDVDTEVFVRALFDYHPKDDPTIPCKDAGLEFRRGDVLQIVSQEDDTWWQARRIMDDQHRAGLIPSRQLHERRVALQRPEALFQMSRLGKINSAEADYVALHGIHIAGLRKSFRLSKKDRWSQETHTKWMKREPISSYQEVVYRIRTTRWELLRHRLGSVRRVLAEGKVCLLDVQPHAAKLLYTAEFKPYVAFVRPPAIEQLRFSRRKAKILAGCEEPVPSRTFMEADFEEMINATKEMENEYAYLFEKIAINDDLARVFTEIRAELRKLEKESNWIPKIWAEKL